jgi:hypothetical protein
MGWGPRSPNLLFKRQMQEKRKYVLFTQLIVENEAGKKISGSHTGSVCSLFPFMQS